jgi:hypothetical protein
MGWLLLIIGLMLGIITGVCNLWLDRLAQDYDEWMPNTDGLPL